MVDGTWGVSATWTLTGALVLTGIKVSEWSYGKKWVVSGSSISSKYGSTTESRCSGTISTGDED